MKRLIPFTLFLALGSALLLSNDKEKPAAAGAPALKIVEEDMDELMESLFEMPYERLKTALKAEAAPTADEDWDTIKSDVLIWAESCNLILDRPPHPDDAADWAKMTVETRDVVSVLYEASKYKRWEELKPAYEASVKSCNVCHERFADMRPLKF